MQFVVGSALILALVFLIFAATVGPSVACLRRLRGVGYILSFALAGLVTAGDVWAFGYLLAPSLALYEMTALLSR